MAVNPLPRPPENELPAPASAAVQPRIAAVEIAPPEERTPAEWVNHRICQARVRLEAMANCYPMRFIVGFGIAGAVLGVLLRIRRSNAYAGNQFFRKWRA